MVHCRTPFGAWKHANRSYKRGYATRPPGFFGGDLLPPPAPPISFGEEFSGNRHSDWNVLCDEEEWGTLERNCPTETICPTGAVTDYLEWLDAPITAKDISWPKVLCLIDLLDQESAEPESETVAAKPLASLEDFLELPSTNGDIGQVLEELTVLPSQQPPLDPHQLSFAERRQMFSPVVASTLEAEEQHCNSNIGKSAYGCDLPGRALLRPIEENPIDIDSIGENILQALHDVKHELKVALEIERAAGKKSFEEAIGNLAVFKDEITDKIMAIVVDMLPTPAAIVRTEDDEVLAGPLDGSREMLDDGDSGKEQRAEEGHWDIDSIGNILQGIHSLRIYCFPIFELVYSEQSRLKR